MYGDHYEKQGTGMDFAPAATKPMSFMRPPAAMGPLSAPNGRPAGPSFGTMPSPFDRGAGVIDRFGPMGGDPTELQPPGPPIRPMQPDMARQRFMGRMGRRRILRRGGVGGDNRQDYGGGTGPFAPPPQLPD